MENWNNHFLNHYPTLLHYNKATPRFSGWIQKIIILFITIKLMDIKFVHKENPGTLLLIVLLQQVLEPIVNK